MNLTRKQIHLIPVYLLLLFISCNDIYKAGNLVVLDYDVETNLTSDVVMRYLDTLAFNYGYGIPDKWMRFNKLVDLDSITNKRIYFKSEPEEMYLISDPAGLLRLADVYNPKIRQTGWVAQKDSMPLTEKNRVLNRFKIEILDAVESMAKRDRLPDSVVYK